MRLARNLAFLAALAALALTAGCAGVGYRDTATITQTRYATVENFGDQPITAEQVDGLLEEVAEILNVTLDARVPKVRIIVTTPTRIADLYRATTAVLAHGSYARALYFPGASLVMVSSYDRATLGHELAHYVTDHYLKSTPRGRWERVAHSVEDRLPARAPAPATRPDAGAALAARTADTNVPLERAD
jgi:hypothetical protein